MAKNFLKVKERLLDIKRNPAPFTSDFVRVDILNVLPYNENENEKDRQKELRKQQALSYSEK